MSQVINKEEYICNIHIKVWCIIIRSKHCLCIHTLISDVSEEMRHFLINKRCQGGSSNSSRNKSSISDISAKTVRTLVPADKHQATPSADNSSSIVPVSDVNLEGERNAALFLDCALNGSLAMNEIIEQAMTSSDGKRFSCPICPRSFDRQYSLERHLILHKADKKYECNECDAKYSLAANLTRHQRQVHTQAGASHLQNGDQQLSENPPKVLSHKNKENMNFVNCSDCPLSYQINSDAYKIHRYSHEARADLSGDPPLESRVVQRSMNTFTKDGTLIERQQPKFCCTDCTSSFNTWEGLIEHVAQHGVPIHSTLMADYLPTETNNISDIENVSRNIGKPHKCELCYKSFASEERLSVSVITEVVINYGRTCASY